MNNTNNEKQLYDEEAALVAQMNDICDRLIQDAFVQLEELMNNTKNAEQSCEEAALVAQMKDNFERMIQDFFDRIDAMNTKIDDTLNADCETDC